MVIIITADLAGLPEVLARWDSGLGSMVWGVGRRICVRSLGLERVIENGLPSWVELQQEIEIRDVACEHHAAIPGCRQEDQSIIQRFALLTLAVMLQPRQESGEDAGFAPGCPVRCEDPMIRPQVDGRCDLRNHVGRIGVRRVKQTGEGCQFCFGYGAVPEAASPECDLHIIRKSTLKSVDVDGGVE